MTDTYAGGTERRDELAFGGICPVCDEPFTDGYQRLTELRHESIEGVRLCVIDPPDSVLMHLPDDQNDRPEDSGMER